ncbi:MAG: hypothetical protein GY856_08540 [bacterium]|nr:hypothetical protein [bacterium]
MISAGDRRLRPAVLMFGVFFLITFAAALNDTAPLGNVAGAILRDFDRHTHELFFSRPIRRLDYLLGRFLGGWLVCVTAFMGAVAAPPGLRVC